MKTFKDLKAFEKRIIKTTDWDDYFQLGGKMWHIYEYGGGSMMHMDYDYVYFRRAHSNDLIYVKYHCPSIQAGEVKQKYQFISLELIPDAWLWR